MNTHPFDPETVMAYFDGELPASDAASLATHLETCSDCSNLAGKFQSVSRDLAKWQVERLPAQAADPSTLAAVRLTELS